MKDYLKFSFTCTVFLHYSNPNALVIIIHPNILTINIINERNQLEVCWSKLSSWSNTKFTPHFSFKLVKISKGRHVRAENNNSSCQRGWNKFPPVLVGLYISTWQLNLSHHCITTLISFFFQSKLKKIEESIVYSTTNLEDDYCLSSFCKWLEMTLNENALCLKPWNLMGKKKHGENWLKVVWMN